MLWSSRVVSYSLVSKRFKNLKCTVKCIVLNCRYHRTLFMLGKHCLILGELWFFSSQSTADSKLLTSPQAGWHIIWLSPQSIVFPMANCHGYVDTHGLSFKISTGWRGSWWGSLVYPYLQKPPWWWYPWTAASPLTPLLTCVHSPTPYCFRFL